MRWMSGITLRGKIRNEHIRRKIRVAQASKKLHLHKRETVLSVVARSNLLIYCTEIRFHEIEGRCNILSYLHKTRPFAKR